MGQMEAAARERDEAEEVARRRRKARRSTIVSRASLGTPHASQLRWTSVGDDGEDGDTEEEVHVESVLTDVEENDDEGCEPRSPAEEPTEEDRDFIVPDGYERERDETYVETEPEDSEEEEIAWVQMIEDNTHLTPAQTRLIGDRLSSIRGTQNTQGDMGERTLTGYCREAEGDERQSAITRNNTEEVASITHVDIPIPRDDTDVM